MNTAPNPVIRLRVGCKINLYLHITGVRADGMHELDTLFWPLAEPHDELLLYPGGDGLRVACALTELDPASNTLTKAWNVYAQSTGFAPGLTVEVSKGIPTGAGLGGGSADAAALLLWLDTHNPQPVGRKALQAMAVHVGADVPFFIAGQPCRARGVGEHLEPCLDLAAAVRAKGLAVLVVCPHVFVSTPWAYGAWDAALHEGTVQCCTDIQFPHIEKEKDLTTCVESSRRGFFKGQKTDFSWMQNSFEIAVFKVYPQLKTIQNELLKQGAYASVMSGSGSSMVGVFGCLNDAMRARAVFEEQGLAVFSQAL